MQRPVVRPVPASVDTGAAIAGQIARLLAVLSMFLVGCGSGGPCACTRDWPQLLIGIIPPLGFMGDVRATLQSLDVRLWDGTIQSVLPEPNGCPEAVVALPCSQAVYDGINSQAIGVTAVSVSGTKVSAEIPIKARNNCGKDVAYVQILVDGDDSVGFGGVRYLSPCP